MKKVLAFIFAVFMFYIPYYVHSANGLYFDLEYSGDKIQLNRGLPIVISITQGFTSIPKAKS